MSQRASGQLNKALQLIEGAGSVEEAKQRIREAIAAFDRQPVEETSGNVRTRGRTYFDRLIESMLDQVKRAESREALIHDTLRALGENAEMRAGICYLVLEGFVRPNGDVVDMFVAAFQAVQSQRMQNFVRNYLSKLAGSTLIRDVLVDRETYEFLPTTVLRSMSYFGEFDELVDTRHKNVWLCALPLPPADAQRPSRMLVVLYPIAGTDEAPTLPRGAMQEWRTLTFLRVAYEMLNHQLASTGELVAHQRREVLADLGPGLVNHEINQQLKALDESSNLINWAVRQLEHYVPADDRSFDTVIDGLANVLKAVKRLRHIADAFNNLERRPTQVPVSVGQLIGEIATLLNHRIAEVGAKLTCDGNLDVEIVTDASLIEHVFINILANALEEMQAAATALEGEKDANRPRSFLPQMRILCRETEHRIVIEILNNGPPITLSRPERIFEKGFTTKPRGLGHGLGLYLCRIVMTYLGGAISLLEPENLEPGFNVGFCLEMPIVRKGSDDITVHRGWPQHKAELATRKRTL